MAAEKKSKKWIQSAITSPGSFSAKAKRAGKSTSAFAKEKASAGGRLGKQARLAQTLSKLRGKKKRKGSRKAGRSM